MEDLIFTGCKTPVSDASRTRTVLAGKGGAEGRLQDDEAYLASLAPSLREEGNVKEE